LKRSMASESGVKIMASEDILALVRRPKVAGR
jgi:hypothetical protein